MKKIFNKAANHEEAEDWDIQQQINMTPGQKQKIAKELKERFYGSNPPDVKSTRKFVKLKLNISSK